jgi:hypothetical protein
MVLKLGALNTVGGLVATALTTSIHAQSLSLQTTKSAPVTWDHVYTNLETRHYTLIKADRGEDMISRPTYFEVRPVIGISRPEKRFNFFVTFGAIKRPATDQIAQRRTEAETRVTVLKSVAGSSEPYVRAFLPSGGKPTEFEIGVRQFNTTKVPLRDGQLRFSYELKPFALLNSEGSDAKIRNSSGNPASEYGLVGNENKDNEVTEPNAQRHLPFGSKVMAGMGFEPDEAPGFLAQFAVAQHVLQTPKYELYENGKIYESYKLTRSIEHELLFAYKRKDGVTISNEMNIYFEGLWARPQSARDRSGKPWFENIVRVDYALY